MDVIASFSTWFRTISSALNNTLWLIGLSNLFRFSLTEFLNIHRRFWFVLLSDIANTQLSKKSANKQVSKPNKKSIDVNFESKKYEDEEKVEIEKLWKHFQQFRFIQTDVSFQDNVEIDNQLAVYQEETDEEIINLVNNQD
ncbi:hypothetical protein BpHYR1_053412 [Brachionus plicatilis]|uniref:Uncharacterized protein n=1 Tax=Brachionus plicatilis TaxID=10195 RepID=A0A3M7S0J5_BRAPC|nr:hypothetical protein BpHYR1_053412 [Brachionus plicatilis]